jgi:hypothetical protein
LASVVDPVTGTGTTGTTSPTGTGGYGYYRGRRDLAGRRAQAAEA